ncbi:hypothetical protein BD310DRAFT_425757 [Dichomitus squalens]|uniref:Heme oxygenase-like protein n=1 Tax=Dichomitus squalens TaxID=114155 RepID=A0A4Q9PWZ4_9APHY|nr:hypothetical protein BD310DRAFT_425757 [Dichomitus squalens]
MSSNKVPTAGVDLSQPIATVLREGTREAHQRAEHSQGAQSLTRGELDREEYARFLMLLWHVYDAFERALEQHATHPVLAPTHNPGLFARSANLAADISYILQVPEPSWQAHPVHAALVRAPPPALARYVGRIEELAAGPDPARLLAHAYVRYLGDLSGGQFIRRRIAKAYGLEGGVGGVSFYEFRTLTGSLESANAGEMKRIKEWYRDGMNEGVGDNAELKAAILEEANLAFEFNTGLFDELKPPSRPSTIATTATVDVVPTPLHSPVDSSSPPSTPFVEDMGDSPELAAIKARGGSKTVFEATEGPTSSVTFAATSVIAFIVAFSIAHFTLVVGGFTGSKGYAKLEIFTQWLDNFFGSGSSPAQT